MVPSCWKLDSFFSFLFCYESPGGFKDNTTTDSIILLPGMSTVRDLVKLVLLEASPFAPVEVAWVVLSRNGDEEDSGQD